MKVYLAARYSRAAEMRDVAERLKTLGHQVTSRWIEGGHEVSKELEGEEADLQKGNFAGDDLSDLLQARCVISFTEEPRSATRGGRHVEFGVGLAKHMRLIVIGPKEHVFHCLPQVEHYESFEAALTKL